jgi:hypothetical protein
MRQAARLMNVRPWQDCRVPGRHCSVCSCGCSRIWLYTVYDSCYTITLVNGLRDLVIDVEGILEKAAPTGVLPMPV